MGTGTREDTKRLVGADRATSATVVCLLRVGDDDLVRLVSLVWIFQGHPSTRRTACVREAWQVGGRGLAPRAEKTRSQKNAPKTRKLPHVAARCVGQFLTLRLLCLK